MEDIFVTRLTPAGKRIAAVRLGGSGEEQLHDLDLGHANRVLISGRFADAIDVDPGSGLIMLRKSHGSTFLVRLGAEFPLSWARQFDLGPWGTEQMVLAVGSNNSVFGAGGFSGGVDLNPRSAQFSVKSWAGGFGIKLEDIFAVHFTSGGTFIDAPRFGRDWVVQAGAIAVHSAGRIFVAGQFAEKVDFDPGAGIWPLTASHAWDAFLMQLSI